MPRGSLPEDRGACSRWRREGASRNWSGIAEPKYGHFSAQCNAPCSAQRNAPGVPQLSHREAHGGAHPGTLPVSHPPSPSPSLSPSPSPSTSSPLAPYLRPSRRPPLVKHSSEVLDRTEQGATRPAPRRPRGATQEPGHVP